MYMKVGTSLALGLCVTLQPPEGGGAREKGGGCG